MKNFIRGKLGTFLVGVVIGALCIWVFGLLVHIPGENTANTAVTTYSSNMSHQSSTTTSNPLSNADPKNNAQASSTLPSAVPIYTPSSLNSSSNNTFVYSSQSPDYTVINFYGEELSNDGWKITTESTENGSTTINASGNGYTMSVSITGANNNGSHFTVQQS
jgi:hypothetical protein